ncbi:MAG: hypothetical protein ACKPEY_12340 [Planctomycetota bacterium]
MNLPSVDPLVPAIHAAGRPLVLIVTGGGSLAISRLLTVPGASHTILEALVPYSSESLTNLLGKRPEQFCSAATARALAAVAHQRATRWHSAAHHETPPPPNHPAVAPRVLGVACTASLVSAVPKRGAHRLHLALHDDAGTEQVSVELQRGARDRLAEESLTADLILSSIARACNGTSVSDLPGSLTEHDTWSTRRVDACREWQELLSGQRATVATNQATPSVAANLPQLLFPGSFNPLHQGHQQIAEIASRLIGVPTEFEMAIENVDKPPLDYLTIEDRRQQFTVEQRLWLTREPTFVGKARIFPGATFVVGADTIIRIAQPKYYGGSDAACRAAVAEIERQGCRFLVFGRMIDGAFRTLDELPIAPDLRALCTGVPATEFRCDVSSTELRGLKHGGAEDI